VSFRHRDLESGYFEKEIHMKKLIKLGNVAQETRTSLVGIAPDGAEPVRVSGRCIVPQIFNPAGGNFTLTTATCD
jgi:hypothetical protein